MTAPDFKIRDLKPFFPLLIISLIFKLVLSAVIPLTSDEAYYWVWSHHMQLSFFDHPAAVAWLFWLTHPIENFGAAARWAGVILSHGTLVLWLLILKPIMTRDQMRFWLWLALLSPLIGAGSLLITPDIPLMFCWALSLLLFLRWLEQPTASRALLLGLGCGLGFCSKYVIVLEPMFLFFATLAIPSWRLALKKSWWLILIGVIIGSTPVWLWNYMNHFISFRFQAEHGLGNDVWKPNWTYEYILLQIALIFPPIVYWAVKGTKKAPVWLWLLAWGPLAFFVFTSFRGYVEANWPIISYAEVFALAVFAMPGMTRGYRATIAVWSFALIALLVLILTQWSPHGRLLRTREFYQFDSLRTAAAEYSPIYARSYQMASQLSFDLKKPIYKLHGMNRRDFYDFLSESLPTSDQFYVLVERNNDVLPALYLNEGYSIVSREPINKNDPSNIFELWVVKKTTTESK